MQKIIVWVIAIALVFWGCDALWTEEKHQEEVDQNKSVMEQQFPSEVLEKQEAGELIDRFNEQLIGTSDFEKVKKQLAEEFDSKIYLVEGSSLEITNPLSVPIYCAIGSKLNMERVEYYHIDNIHCGIYGDAKWVDATNYILINPGETITISEFRWSEKSMDYFTRDDTSYINQYYCDIDLIFAIDPKITTAKKPSEYWYAETFRVYLLRESKPLNEEQIVVNNQKVVCSSCGQELEEKDVFCSACGAKQ